MKTSQLSSPCCTSKLMLSSPRTIKAASHAFRSTPGIRLAFSGRGYRKDLGFGVVDFGREFEAIQYENSLGRSVTDSLVSSMKGWFMIKEKLNAAALDVRLGYRSSPPKV